MTQLALCILAGASFAVLLAPQLQADTIDLSNVKTFAVPFASQDVYQAGINDSGVIAGSVSVGPTGAGFVLPTSGIPFEVQKSNSNETQINGLNNSGTLVGLYGTATGVQGFSYSGGMFTPITVGTNTDITGINNHGDIVGSYGPYNATSGFLIQGGVTTTFNAPGPGNGTYVTGVNDADQVVGYSDSTSGFLRQSNGLFASLDFTPSGINDNGILVGNANAPFPSYGSEGIVMVGGIDYTYSFPGSAQTFIYGINNDNEVVGFYLDSSYTGYLFEGQVVTAAPEPSMEALSGLLTMSAIVLIRRRILRGSNPRVL